MTSAVPCVQAAYAALFLFFANPALADVAVSLISPAPGSSVSTLSSVSLTFTGPVSNIDPTALLVDGEPAQAVSGTGAGPYTFTFAQPVAGTVNVGFGVDVSIAPVSGLGQFTAPDSWTYQLSDSIAPAAATVAPAAGSTAGAISQARVTFNESITGVTAGDLLVNGVPATSVTGSLTGPYVFNFSAPGVGSVNFTWAIGHAIEDVSGNAFDGAGWSVTRSAAGSGYLVINEFAAINPSTTFLDSDGDNEPWIEIHNPGAVTVDLTGWALTDDGNVPDKWIFPNRSLAGNAYLVIFASSKDRRPGSGELHTNFKLGVNSGYLALVKPDLPRINASEFLNFPAQRSGYGYGLLSGQVRYLIPPTPGAANNTSTGLSGAAAAPTLSSSRGYYNSPFSLTLTSGTAGSTIRYTTDGREPTDTIGTPYTAPIPISSTTVLRTAAFASGFVPSATVTATYLFLDQVIDQLAAPAGFPTTWGTNNNFPENTIPADYAMDRDPLRVTPTDSNSAIDPVKLQRFNDGLRELPSLSVAIPNRDMFASTGMYHSNNVQNKNFPAKAASIEMILPDGTTAFATTVGLGVKGNASREPQKNPKHALGLKFKPEFGPSKLEYPIFPETPADEYDNLVLRAEFGFSWRHWDSTQRNMSNGIRDIWVKETMRDMGGVASHSRLVHLYINGLYFGVYDITEDPNAAFGESFLGGQAEDYDAIEQGILKDGTITAYNALTSLPAATDNAKYEDFKTHLEMSEFIDYMLLHFFIGSQDWGANKNWSALRQRAGGTFTSEGKFRYIPWDEENVLINTNHNRVSSTDVPSGLHTKLDDNAEYRLDFADRVHRSIVAPGGALTTPSNVARWQKWQDIWDKPIVVESSRWGDYRRDAHPYSSGPYALYTREAQWLAENNRITTDHFPTRATVIMQQLRDGGLYPTLNAPELRIGGTAVGSGLIPPGSQLSMVLPAAPGGTTSAGTIYYTTDSSDPRVIYSGAISSGALAYGSTPLAIDGPVIVKARALHSGTWSALNEAVFTTSSALPPVRISERMYNPAGGSQLEYVEIVNTGAFAVDLNGWYFTGVNYVFPPGMVIAAGSRMVIAINDDPAGWRSGYTGVTPGAYYRGSLSNSGEAVSLYTAKSQLVSSVDYKDKSPWPTSPDGNGYSLELVDSSLGSNAVDNWQASATIGGSAGIQNSLPVPPTITTHPLDQLIPQGAAVNFSTTASGKALKYQWMFGANPVTGATSSSYGLVGVTPANDGAFQCTVSNLGGSLTTNAARLVVSQTFSQWAASNDLAGSDAAENADADKDGIRNIEEFYHHLDPNVPATQEDRAALPTVAVETVAEQPMLSLTYRINRRAALASATFQQSATLDEPWTPVTPDSLVTLSTDPVTGDPRVRARFPMASEVKASFLRMALYP